MALDFMPRAAQQKMRDFILEHHRCNLWADPGVGKTGGSYVAIDILKLLGSEFFPWLVLAPKKVAVDVWPREQRKWNQFRDLRIVNLAGREDTFDRVEQLRRPADIYVINYDIVQWLVEHHETKNIRWPFRGVIADESTRLKNFRLRKGGKRATALARMQKYVGRWINLTGTCAPNGYKDLWGQCWFLDRGERLGRTYGEFMTRYFYEHPYTGEIKLRRDADEQKIVDETELRSAKAIIAAIADITLSLRSADYFDLQPLEHNHIFVHMKPEAMEAYRRMETEMYVELEGKSAEAMNAATVTNKCLQIASGCAYTEPGSGEYIELDASKLDALESLVNDMAGEPLLVAYHWKFDLARIQKKFPYAREIKTSEDIDAWNAKKIRLGLIYPGSGGHGIDLAVGGHHLCFYSQWWDLEAYLQVIERLGPTRQAQHGLNRPVFLHYLIASGTLDETVMERLERKRITQHNLIERMKK